MATSEEPPYERNGSVMPVVAGGRCSSRCCRRLAGDVGHEKKDEHRAARSRASRASVRARATKAPKMPREGCDPGEPPLLGERGEDEVGVADREEPEPALRPLLSTPAEDPPEPIAIRACRTW